VQELTDAPVSFGVIKPEHWYQPDWIDEDKATLSRQNMEKNQVIYGGMCAPPTGLLAIYSSLVQAVFRKSDTFVQYTRANAYAATVTCAASTLG
jgi:hypothetical protein